MVATLEFHSDRFAVDRAGTRWSLGRGPGLCQFRPASWPHTHAQSLLESADLVAKDHSKSFPVLEPVHRPGWNVIHCRKELTRVTDKDPLTAGFAGIQRQRGTDGTDLQLLLDRCHLPIDLFELLRMLGRGL